MMSQDQTAGTQMESATRLGTERETGTQGLVSRTSGSRICRVGAGALAPHRRFFPNARNSSAVPERSWGDPEPPQAGRNHAQADFCARAVIGHGILRSLHASRLAGQQEYEVLCSR